MAGKEVKADWTQSAGESVLATAISKDGSQIAVGTPQSWAVFDAASGNKLAEKESSGRVTSLCFEGQGKLLVGSQGSLHLWSCEQDSILTSLNLTERTTEDTADNNVEDAVFIAPQPGGEYFGITSQQARILYIVTAQLVIESKLELLSTYGKITQLSWLSKSSIVATAAEGLQAWRYADSGTKPSLTLGRSVGLVTAATSPAAPTLASGSRDGVVYIWTITENAEGQGEEAFMAELGSTLKSYAHEVNTMCWNSSGRYLATADGHIATTWDVRKLLEEDTTATVCSGHEQGATILHTDFQEDGPMLATGANNGAVIIFNSDTFQAGKHSQPLAVINAEFESSPISALSWLPGGKLVAASESGKLGLWSLSQSLQDAITPTAPRAEVSEPVAQGNPVERPANEAAAQNTNGLLERTHAKSHNPRVHRTTSNLSAKSLEGHAGSGKPLRGPVKISHGLGHTPKSSNTSIGDRSSGLHRKDSSNYERGLRPTSSLRSQDSLSDRSQSLQGRGGSLERQQLSATLMHRIQQVKKGPSQPNQQREPSGWGMGSTSGNVPSPQHPVPVNPAGMHMPYNNAAPGQVPQGYMMYPNQPMGQQNMARYGFTPGMTHVPMLAHPQAAQQGMMDGGGMHGHYPHQMLYMPMAPNMSPQMQWPMVQSPWMGPYMMHPGQQALQDQMGQMSISRANSMPPDGQAGNEQWAAPSTLSEIGKSEEARSSGSGTPADRRRDISKNSISLPQTVTKEWRGRMRNDGPAPPLNKVSSVGKLRHQNSGNVEKVNSPSEASRSQALGSEAGTEGKFTSPARGDSFNLRGGKITVRVDEEELAAVPLDSKAPVTTVYIGNLTPVVDESAIVSAFQKFGPFTNVQVIRDKHSMQSRGFAFVSYSDPNCARAAIDQMNGRIMYGIFRGRALRVGPSNRVM